MKQQTSTSLQNLISELHGFCCDIIPAHTDIKPLATVGALAMMLGGISVTAHAQSAQLTILENFNGSDGQSPRVGLAQDSSGNLYGTTNTGGLNGKGVVYKISPTGVYTKLLDFDSTTGGGPYSDIAVDSLGNLYGTTQGGGTYGYGTIFKIVHTGASSYSYSKLYDFNGTDTNGPYSGITLDSAGNLYGTTQNGGAHGFGTVYKLSTGGTFSHLVDFDGTNGKTPTTDLTMDSAGNLYGTTILGGANSEGTVFKLKANLGGSYTFSKLLDFAGLNGNFPYGGISLDSAGNLYGTTQLGGLAEQGVLFKIDTNGVSSTVHNFNGALGNTPKAGVVIDSSGNMFGTATVGGANNMGLIYEITSSNVYKDILDFSSITGNTPVGTLVLGADNSLYGATTYGGTYNLGTIFKVSVVQTPNMNTPEPTSLMLAVAGTVVAFTVRRRRPRNK